MRINISFELNDSPGEYRQFVHPSARLVSALREGIEQSDEAALDWLIDNVTSIDVAK